MPDIKNTHLITCHDLRWHYLWKVSHHKLVPNISKITCNWTLTQIKVINPKHRSEKHHPKSKGSYTSPNEKDIKITNRKWASQKHNKRTKHGHKILSITTFIKPNRIKRIFQTTVNLTTNNKPKILLNKEQKHETLKTSRENILAGIKDLIFEKVTL